MIRRFSVSIHRWTGLLLAGFLIFEGLSGSLLAFRDQFERLVTPQFYAEPRPGMAPLDLASLAESATALVPQGHVSFVSSAGDRAIVYYRPRQNPATGKPYELGFTQFFLDPWTGNELGRRRVGDISEGMVNLIPFIYLLHTSLSSWRQGCARAGHRVAVVDSRLLHRFLPDAAGLDPEILAAMEAILACEMEVECLPDQFRSSPRQRPLALADVARLRLVERDVQFALGLQGGNAPGVRLQAERGAAGGAR